MLSVLPWFEIPPIPLGPLKIQPFGISVAVGVLVGAHICRRHAERTGLDLDVLQSLIAWLVIPGFLISHVFDVFTYQPEMLLEDPLILLKPWQGISSVGGFIGGVLGFLWFFKRHAKPGLPKLRYADTGALGLLVGMIFGRLGCAIVHDHPGQRSEFFLAVAFPDGPRHDLGLYEMLFLLVMAAIIFPLTRKDRPSGTIVGLVALLYGPVRFGLDFLRIEGAVHADPRYFGLTPAHYVSLGITAIGALLLWYSRARNDSITPAWGSVEPSAEPPAEADRSGKPGPQAKSKSRKKSRK